MNIKNSWNNLIKQFANYHYLKEIGIQKERIIRCAILPFFFPKTLYKSYIWQWYYLKYSITICKTLIIIIIYNHWITIILNVPVVLSGISIVLPSRSLNTLIKHSSIYMLSRMVSTLLIAPMTSYTCLQQTSIF